MQSSLLTSDEVFLLVLMKKINNLIFVSFWHCAYLSHSFNFEFNFSFYETLLYKNQNFNTKKKTYTKQNKYSQKKPNKIPKRPPKNTQNSNLPIYHQLIEVSVTMINSFVKMENVWILNSFVTINPIVTMVQMKMKKLVMLDNLQFHQVSDALIFAC